MKILKILISWLQIKKNFFSVPPKTWKKVQLYQNDFMSHNKLFPLGEKPWSRAVFPKVWSADHFWSAKLSNLVRKKNKTYQIVWKTVFLTQNLFKLSILLLQISISRSADLFYQILWSANILFNVLWSASSKSLGNTGLEVKADGSWPRGRGFKPRHRLLAITLKKNWK
jgi:hypothetical protein